MVQSVFVFGVSDFRNLFLQKLEWLFKYSSCIYAPNYDFLVDCEEI